MILSAETIRELCSTEKPLIEPFNERTFHDGLTFGLGPAGYDVRVEFDSVGKIRYIILEPGEFILASTIERFCMPDDVMGIVHDKSTWARLGLAVQNTVIEPGWTGWLTLELTNHGSKTLSIGHGDGIAHIVFHRLDKPTKNPYRGKYQDQNRGPVEAIHDNLQLSFE